MYGDSYIHSKLKYRGLSSNLHLSVSEEMEFAKNVINTKLHITNVDIKTKRKVAGFLSRRGFRTTVIYLILEKLKDNKFTK